MANYTITDVRFIENSDYQFQINFGYNGLVLTTPNIDRATNRQEVKMVILETARLSDQKRSSDNYGTLKKRFDGKSTLTIEV